MDFLTPAELKSRNKIWWVALFFYVMILMSGASFELSGLDLGKVKPAGETLGRYGMFLTCAALLLTFFVPFAFFLYYSCRKMNVSWKIAILAFFSGWFIAGSISIPLNRAGVKLLRNLVSKTFANVWAPPIVGPIVEETLKLFVVAALLALLGKHLRQHYLITGMAVGMGFQIAEDLDDILHVLKGSHHAYATAMSFTINDRIALSLGSHWCYTGVAAVAIFLIFHEKRKKAGILLLLAAYLDHSLFDVRVLHNTLGLALISGFILAITFYVYRKTLSETRRLSKERKEMHE